MGVSALAAGAVTCVLHQYPGAQVSFLDYAARPTTRTVKVAGQDVEVPLVNLRFSKRLYLPNHIAKLLFLAVCLKLIPSRRFRDWCVNRNAWLAHILETDLFLSVAGGDSFSDIYGFVRFVYVVLPQILVLLLGRRLILLPQTIGPFKASWAQAVAKYILRGAERVYSRDHFGQQTVAALLGPAQSASDKVKFCYDMGFVVDPQSPPVMDVVGFSFDNARECPLVGLNVSGLLLIGGYTRNNMFALSGDYKELMDQLIERMIRQEHARVLLVPHVFGSANEGEADSAACERIYNALASRYGDRLGYVRGRYNQSEIKKIIGMCDFFVGSRMHACIAALSQNIPAAAIAYSDKFAGVLRSIGIASLVLDPRSMKQDEIISAVAALFQRRDDIHKQLEREVPHVRDTVLGLFADSFPYNDRSLRLKAVCS